MADWSFDTTRFGFLWQALNLGDHPFPVQVPSFGRTDRDRAAVARRTRDELRAEGLFHVGPAADLERALRVVARAEQWFDSVWLSGGVSPVRVIAARRDGHTVLLRQEAGARPHHGGDLRLTEVEHSDLAKAVIDELPHTAPGSWRPEPVAADALGDEPDTSPWDTRADVPKDVRELLHSAHPAGGQIGVSIRDGSGTRRRALATRWFDRADDGRYQAVIGPGPDGRSWITISPLDRATLRARLVRAFGELAAS